MAVPTKSHGFPYDILFNRRMVWNIDIIKSFDMFTNHAKYNRPELEALIPNATYITILRHPVKQFESAFGFFNWGKEIRTKDPLATFLDNPQKYIKHIRHRQLTRNCQLYDLGLNLNQTLDEVVVKQKIQSLNKEMDLILLTEYFDESLLLLRDLLCWTVDDILYIPNGIRGENRRQQITPTVKEKILKWNKSDLDLYQYFEKVLLKDIQKYGLCFEHNLREFRKLQSEVFEKCIKKDGPKRVQDKVARPILKDNATTFCLNLWRGDVTFTRLNRVLH
ncbi:galactosylceramide sulfotransferase-like [Saccoglossus kowalevskii]|uniref:Galactosylceramide sulfotransferase-like n=1 Tax=Saccoglossus kowalevskii TaxID=10224 RepID=A0ABM0N1F7_SACKO|nr:PREDICTED: galactosylceramide sulfotransferase-like [Saccoglossus kowalevskii]